MIFSFALGIGLMVRNRETEPRGAPGGTLQAAAFSAGTQFSVFCLATLDESTPLEAPLIERAINRFDGEH